MISRSQHSRPTKIQHIILDFRVSSEEETLLDAASKAIQKDIRAFQSSITEINGGIPIKILSYLETEGWTWSASGVLKRIREGGFRVSKPSDTDCTRPTQALGIGMRTSGQGLSERRVEEFGRRC